MSSGVMILLKEILSEGKDVLIKGFIWRDRVSMEEQHPVGSELLFVCMRMGMKGRVMHDVH